MVRPLHPSIYVLMRGSVCLQSNSTNASKMVSSTLQKLDHTVFHFDMLDAESMVRQESNRIVGQKAATPSQHVDPLTPKMGSSIALSLSKKVASSIAPHCMVLRLPRADMSVNFSICVPRPADIDSQQLQQTWCEQKNHFLLPAIKFSQLLLQQNGLESKQNTSSTEQHRKRQAKDKWHQPKNLEHKQTNSHRQLALCKAMGWGIRRPWLRRSWMQACAISDLSNDSNDPLWPRLQLVSLGPNALIAEMWERSESLSHAAERAKHQLTTRDRWPARCFVEPGPKLQEIKSLIWPPCILWTN